MLALSPALFATNITYWPLEDPIGHNGENYSYRDVIELANSDQSVFLNFPTPPPSDLRSQTRLDCSATPSTATTNSSDLSMALKKLNHNASERERRKKINNLYSSLRALLPASGHTKKLSIPATVSRILKYIPELQQQVEGLVQKREELLSMTNSRQQKNLQVINEQTKIATQTSSSSASASKLNKSEVMVQISTFKFDKNPLSEILQNWKEDGLSVLNASSFESFGGRVFHNLQLQVEGSYSVECGTLGGNLCLYDDNKELLL